MIKNISLQKKAILMVAAILFFIIAVNTSVLTYIAYNKYKRAILSKTTAIGDGMLREINKIVNLGVPIESLEGLNEKLVELISRDDAIGFSMVMDTTGKVLFHSNADSIGIEHTDEATVKALSSKKMLIQTSALFYDLSFPIFDAEEKPVGALRIGVKTDIIKIQLYDLLKRALGISILCFLLSLGLVYFSVSRFIIKPIKEMEKAANRISSGNLQEMIDITGNDEIAKLGEGINIMALNLKNMIAKISEITESVATVSEHILVSSGEVLGVSDLQEKSVDSAALLIKDMSLAISEVAASSKNLSETAIETSSSIMETKTSIEAIAENTNTFSESAHETSSYIEELLSNIKQVADSLDILTGSSGEIASSIEELNATTNDIEERAKESVVLNETVMKNASVRGMNTSNAAIKGMMEIKNCVVSLSEVINMLGKKSVDIGKILKVINDVAEQTNLLALNAAILAAQSGEYGKGFSVVADEIKELAERTSASTKEVAELIKSIQDDTKSSVNMASESITTVENGILLVNDFNETLKNIIESSKNSTSMAKAIQKATEEEALAIRQITSSIENVTGQTEKISIAIQEQHKGSNFIIKEAEKVKDLSSQVLKAINEQKEGTALIAEAIDNVTEQTSQIVSATSRHDENSVEIVNAMENIRSTGKKLISSSNAMNEIINSLHKESASLINELHKFKV
jgi:methyl-accepting chemotaxis protein